MWGDVIAMGRRRRDIASPPRLRFSPLEIFAQRQLQPILPQIFARVFPRVFFGVFGGRSGLPFVFIFLIVHREPARMTGEIVWWSENHALAPLPQRRLASFCRVGRSRPAGLAAVRTYCVPFAVRAIANPGATCNAAGADHGGADFRE